MRAVDDISLDVNRNEIYGLAGESSCGKTTFIKTIAAAIRPPLSVVGGSVRYSFLDRDIYDLTPRRRSPQIRWKHLSYIMQGSMNVLNPVRRVRAVLRRFRLPPHGDCRSASSSHAVEEHLQRLHLAPTVLDAYPHELSGGMRQRVTIALATICRPEFIIADEPTTALDVVVQKDVLAMIREVQQRDRLVDDLRHPRHGGARQHRRPARHHVCGPAGRGGADRRDLRASRCTPTPRISSRACRGSATQSPKKALSGAPPNLADPPRGCRFHPRCPLAMDICRRGAAGADHARPGPSRRLLCGEPAGEAERNGERAAADRARNRRGLLQ